MQGQAPNTGVVQAEPNPTVDSIAGGACGQNCTACQHHQGMWQLAFAGPTTTTPTIIHVLAAATEPYGQQPDDTFDPTCDMVGDREGICNSTCEGREAKPRKHSSCRAALGALSLLTSQPGFASCRSGAGVHWPRCTGWPHTALLAARAPIKA